MLDIGFLLGLAGLALVDAAVTSTIYVTIAILVLARKPASTSIAYAIGQLSSFFLLTLLLYFGSNVMAELLDDFTLWTRRIILVGAAIFFTVLAIRRLKARPRHSITLPQWINPWTAAPFGALLMLADLPFSFPMFLAVERLVDTGITAGTASVVLAGYTFVSSLPTVALILLGLTFRQRVRTMLQRVLQRFSTGSTKPSWPLASLHLSVAILSVSLLVFVLG